MGGVWLFLPTLSVSLSLSLSLSLLLSPLLVLCLSHFACLPAYDVPRRRNDGNSQKTGGLLKKYPAQIEMSITFTRNK